MPKRPKKEAQSWRVYRFKGSRMVAVGTVLANSELEAIKKAIELYSVPKELQWRLAARPVGDN